MRDEFGKYIFHRLVLRWQPVLAETALDLDVGYEG